MMKVFNMLFTSKYAYLCSRDLFGWNLDILSDNVKRETTWEEKESNFI